MTELQESLKKCRIKDNILFLPPINEGMLPNYAEVKKALINAGAKYKSNTFVFPNDAQPYIDRLMGGEKINTKKDLQQFYTPEKTADYVVSLADIKPNHIFLEPEAGQGAIIDAVLRKHPKLKIFCVEKGIDNQLVLNKKYKQENIYIMHPLNDDFLEFDGETKFDRIIMNPPFQNNQDISHIKKAYSCLDKKGKLIAISSTHWRISNNKTEAEFRKWLDSVGAEVKSLPAGTFKESGTNIETLIIVINKK